MPIVNNDPIYSYSAPGYEEIVDSTGINAVGMGLSQQALKALILGTPQKTGLLAKAQAQLSTITGEERFYSTALTNDQTIILRDAVCKLVAALAMQVCWFKRGDGTFEPLQVADERDISQIIAELKEEAFAQATAVSKGEGQAVTQVLMQLDNSTDGTPKYTRDLIW